MSEQFSCYNCKHDKSHDNDCGTESCWRAHADNNPLDHPSRWEPCEITCPWKDTCANAGTRPSLCFGNYEDDSKCDAYSEGTPLSMLKSGIKLKTLKSTWKSVSSSYAAYVAGDWLTEPTRPTEPTDPWLVARNNEGAGTIQF
jgi:hypothetical protein